MGRWITYRGRAIYLKDASDSYSASPVTADEWKPGKHTTSDISDIDDTGRQADEAGKRVAGRWKVDRGDLDAFAKESGIPVEGLSDEAAKTRVAQILIHQWNSSSGSPEHLITAVGAAEHAGLKYEAWDSNKGAMAFFEKNPAMQRAGKSFGVAMYDTTQAYLKAKGITRLDVIRKGGEVETRPFSSWSLNWGGVRHEGAGALVKASVPAKYVLSVPATGFGTRMESEVVLLPRPKKKAKT